MYTINRYLEDTRILTKSLVIKINEVALQINYNQYMETGVKVSNDPHEWKYYINLSGEKHSTNNDIYVYVKETATKELMTKELMSTYTDTRDDLLTRGKQYQELMLEYPDDRAYIDGMLLPVDIDTAINAVNGELLNYDSRYIGYQELSIIRELNDHIKSFLTRWHLKEYYITDNLYLASLVSILITSCYNFILNARLNRVFTNEVHDFHLEHFFRSNYNIWDNLVVLNRKSILWLYKNIRYITKNVGKEHILNEIIENIFTTNKLGIGVYNLELTDAEIIPANISDPTVSYYKKGEPVFKAKPINAFYSGSEKQLTIGEIIRNEMTYDRSLDTDVFDDYIPFYSRLVEKELNNIHDIKQPTKIFDIGLNTLFNMHGINIMQLVIDYWVYYVYTYNPTITTFFTDPNTQQSYNLTMKQGLYYLFKLLSTLLDISNISFDGYKYKEIINTDITKSEMISGLYSAGNMDSLLDIIYDSLPKSFTGIENKLVFQSFIDNMTTLFINTWILQSNVNNITIETNLKHIVNRIFTHGIIDIRYDGTVKTIDEILIAENIIIDITDTYDVNATITELFNTFVGQPFYRYNTIENFTDNCIDIFNKLTSYTTQIIKSVDDTEYTNTLSTGLKINNADYGLITVRSGEIIPLELNHVSIDGTVSDDLGDTMENFNIMNDPGIAYKKALITGIAYSGTQTMELIGGPLEPIVTVEIINT